MTKIFVIDFGCNLPNDGKQKQVKATEVYLLWIFCKKTLSSYWWLIQKGNCKKKILMLLKKKKIELRQLVCMAIWITTRKTRIWSRTTFELCNKAYNQCLQEIVKLNFTLNIRKPSEDSSSDVTMGSSYEDTSSTYHTINIIHK